MISSKIDVSVIVVMYNQPLTLSLSLKALLNQTFQGTSEIIVSDDGSNSQLFSQFRDKFNAADIPLKYVWQQDRHFRAAAARNNGIKISQGEYLIFLDGDMVPELDLIKKHIESHIKPKLLVAGNRRWRGGINDSLFKTLDGKEIEDILYELENNWQVDSASLVRERNERQRRKDWLASPHPWRTCFSGNVSVERAAEVYFDETFVGWGPEDWEFNHRLCVQHGYTPIYRDDITTYHLESPGAVGNIFRVGTHEDIVKYMKNTFYLFDKCPELPLEEVFFGFPRFALDPHTDTWQVVSRPDPSSYNLEEVMQKARYWLSQHESE